MGKLRGYTHVLRDAASARSLASCAGVAVFALLSAGLGTGCAQNSGSAKPKTSTATNSNINTSTSTSTTQEASLILTPASVQLSPGEVISFWAEGGNPPYTFVSADGGGSFKGNEFTAGPQPGIFRVQVRDFKQGASNYASLTISHPLAITPLTKELAYRQSIRFQVTGGIPPYIFSRTTESSVNDGTLDTSIGEFTAGVTAGSVVIQVQDSSPVRKSATATLTIKDMLALQPDTIAIGVGRFTILEAIGGVGPFTWSIVSGGGTLADAEATENGSKFRFTAPSVPGTTVVKVTAGTKSALATITTAKPLRASLDTSVITTTGKAVLSAIDGVPPYTFKLVQGGAVINDGSSSTQRIITSMGSPGNVKIEISDADKAKTTVDLRITLPLALSPENLTLCQGTTRSYAASGGVPPYVFSETGSGSITAAGLYTAGTTAGERVTITVTDSAAPTPSKMTVNAVIGGRLTVSGAGSSRSVPIPGALRLTVTQGLAPFAFVIDSDLGKLVDVKDSSGNVIPNQKDLQALKHGQLIPVYIRDANSCEAVFNARPQMHGALNLGLVPDGFAPYRAAQDSNTQVDDRTIGAVPRNGGGNLILAHRTIRTGSSTREAAALIALNDNGSKITSFNGNGEMILNLAPANEQVIPKSITPEPSGGGFLVAADVCPNPSTSCGPGYGATEAVIARFNSAGGRVWAFRWGVTRGPTGPFANLGASAVSPAFVRYSAHGAYVGGSYLKGDPAAPRGFVIRLKLANGAIDNSWSADNATPGLLARGDDKIAGSWLRDVAAVDDNGRLIVTAVKEVELGGEPTLFPYLLYLKVNGKPFGGFNGGNNNNDKGEVVIDDVYSDESKYQVVQIQTYNHGGTPKILVFSWSESGTIDGGETSILSRRMLASGAPDPSWQSDGTYKYSVKMQGYRFFTPHFKVIQKSGTGKLMVIGGNPGNTPLWGTTSTLYSFQILENGATDPAYKDPTRGADAKIVSYVYPQANDGSEHPLVRRFATWYFRGTVPTIIGTIPSGTPTNPGGGDQSALFPLYLDSAGP